MGEWEHIHQVDLVVEPLSVGELDWRSCVCIWHISTWFFLKRFSIQWSSTRVEACLLRILRPHVGCLDAFYNRSCRTGCFAVNNIGCFALQSRFECFFWPFTLIVPCSSIKGNNLAMFNVFRIYLLLAIEIETVFALLGKFCLLWGSTSAFSWTSCSRQWSFKFGWRYCIVSSQIVGLILFLLLQYW